jgi:hypothetical protein
VDVDAVRYATPPFIHYVFVTFGQVRRSILPPRSSSTRGTVRRLTGGRSASSCMKCSSDTRPFFRRTAWYVTRNASCRTA